MFKITVKFAENEHLQVDKTFKFSKNFQILLPLIELEHWGFSHCHCAVNDSSGSSNWIQSLSFEG